MKIWLRNPPRQYGGHSLCIFAFVVAISLVFGEDSVTPLEETSTMALDNNYSYELLALPQEYNLTEILTLESNQSSATISILADSRENEIELNDLVAITTNESSPLTTTITPTTATEAATTATTTTQRPLTEAELKAKAFLAENNATLEASKLDLHKVGTRAVLEFLETFIHELEAVQHNMTQLLSSPIETHNFSDYRAEEDALEIEMTALEGRLTNNRVQVNKYSAATRDAERQFRNLHQTLVQIIVAQFPSTTDIRSVLGIVDRSPEEIREFLRESLHGAHGGQQYRSANDDDNDNSLLSAASIPTAITEFITSLQFPENRNASYLYILQELRKNYRLLPPDVHKGLMFQLVKDVYQFPEFEELRSPLPDAIQLLLKNEPRGIKTQLQQRRHHPQAHLYIDSHNNLVTTTTSAGPAAGLQKIWKLLPIEDGKYYLIAHEPSRQIIGIQQDEDSGSFRIHLKKASENFIRNSLQNMEVPGAATRTSRGSSSASGTFDPHDTKFHWDVKIVPGEPMSFKFINMDFNLALGWSRGTGGTDGPVSLKAVSIYSSSNIGAASASSNAINVIERWELQ